MQRSEHRIKARGLADLLLPFALIDDGILLQQDGSLLAGWSYHGPDMMSAAASEMDALSARLNQVLRLGVRLDGTLRCDPLLRSGLSRARSVSRSNHSRNRR